MSVKPAANKTLLLCAARLQPSAINPKNALLENSSLNHLKKKAHGLSCLNQAVDSVAY